MEESDTKTNSVDITEIKGVVSSIKELMENTEPINLNVKHRTLIFILMGMVYCFSSSDGGIIPQQNSKIKEDFEDNDNALVGFFGSVDYIGRVIGAIVFSFILGKVNRKFVLFITLGIIIIKIYKINNKKIIAIELENNYNNVEMVRKI